MVKGPQGFNCPNVCIPECRDKVPTCQHPKRQCAFGTSKLTKQRLICTVRDLWLQCIKEGQPNTPNNSISKCSKDNLWLEAGKCCPCILPPSNTHINRRSRRPCRPRPST